MGLELRQFALQNPNQSVLARVQVIVRCSRKTGAQIRDRPLDRGVSSVARPKDVNKVNKDQY